MSTCRTQSDSTPENTKLTAFIRKHKEQLGVRSTHIPNKKLRLNNNNSISRALNPSVSNLHEAQSAVHVPLKLNKLYIFNWNPANKETTAVKKKKTKQKKKEEEEEAGDGRVKGQGPDTNISSLWGRGKKAYNLFGSLTVKLDQGHTHTHTHTQKKKTHTHTHTKKTNWYKYVTFSRGYDYAEFARLLEFWQCQQASTLSWFT